jgi:predicted histone-like DNA-binding protein
MKYKVVERGNPSNPSAAKKQYANPVNTGKMTIRDVAREISARSSLSRGDVESVLNNFMEVLPTFLKLGMSVQMGSFGTVRLNLQSNGADPTVGFKPSDIKGVKVIFTPSVELKESLRNVSFEEQK